MEKNKELVLFMPSIDGGGVEKNLIIIANFLIKKIDNIILITYNSSFNKYFDKKIKILNVVKKNTTSVSKYTKYIYCLYLLIRLLISGKKLVVLSFQANIYCAILSAFFKFSLISRSNSSPSGWDQNFFKKKIFSYFFKYVNFIIVNSHEFQKELFKKYKLKSIVIYNPLNLSEIKNKSKVNFKLNFFKEKKILKIINIARFTDQKDHLTLLKSFKIVSKKINAKLLLVGYGPERENIINFVNKNKLSKKIKILDFQINPYKYIKKSDILILSSKYEGLPNVLLEALSLKKFIISSNCPTGPKEILDNGKYGFLFNVGDHIDLSKKIIKYSKSTSTYNKMCLLGFKSLNRFDYETNCNKYLEIIKKLINKNDK